MIKTVKREIPRCGSRWFEDCTSPGIFYKSGQEQRLPPRSPNIQSLRFPQVPIKLLFTIPSRRHNTCPYSRLRMHCLCIDHRNSPALLSPTYLLISELIHSKCYDVKTSGHYADTVRAMLSHVSYGCDRVRQRTYSSQMCAHCILAARVACVWT